jgi:hypothetical protein
MHASCLKQKKEYVQNPAKHAGGNPLMPGPTQFRSHLLGLGNAEHEVAPAV